MARNQPPTREAAEAIAIEALGAFSSPRNDKSFLPRFLSITGIEGALRYPPMAAREPGFFPGRACSIFVPPAHEPTLYGIFLREAGRRVPASVVAARPQAPSGDGSHEGSFL